MRHAIKQLLKRIARKLLGASAKPKPRRKNSKQVKASDGLMDLLKYPFNRDHGRADVVVYFFGTVHHTYQIAQWWPVFTELNKFHKVRVVSRSLSVYKRFMLEPGPEIVYAHTINDLTEIYDATKPRVVLYVNNGYKNFQSLIYTDALHVHVNHGESEKESMHSNQVKAYDGVFCVGPAGVDRYARHLLNFDRSKFHVVGRPQLDFLAEPKMDIPEGRKVVLYAPTWAATHGSMNYSSVASFGKAIAESVLDNPELFLLYKPHPATGKTCSDELEAHELIKQAIAESGNGLDISSSDVFDALQVCDIAIFDNTSVAIDYLFFDKPFLATDVYASRSEIPKFIEAGKMLDEADYQNLSELILRLIHSDETQAQRREIARYYLGDFEAGEASKKFIGEIGAMIRHCEDLQAQRSRTRGESSS